MKSASWSIMIVFILSSWPGPGLSQEGPGKIPSSLTIEQAVGLALKQSPQIRGADYEIAASDAQRKIARSRFGPVLQLELRALFYNAPPSIGGGSMSEEDLAGLQALAGADPFDNAMIDLFNGLPSMFESEKYDFNTTVRIVQPLTQLYTIYHGYKLSELGVDIAQVAKSRREDDLAYRVRETCLRILQVQAGVRALEQAEQTVAAHVERAGHFLDSGLIGRNDVLQAKARLAGLRGDLLAARHGAKLARANLAMLLALPADSQFEVSEPALNLDTHQVQSLAQAQAQAAAQRPELQELNLRMNQADHGVKAAWSGYIPQLSAMAMYQHNEGSLMKPPAWTGGLMLTWNVWEWGATHYGIEAAEAGRMRVATAKEELIRGIQLQVHSAWLKIQESHERIEIVKSELTQAEEQLRIEQELYEQQQNTSTDVLDAQSRLTGALVKRDSAQYDYMIALAAMHKALGRRDAIFSASK
jgi:outer membrane protein